MGLALVRAQACSGSIYVVAETSPSGCTMAAINNQVGQSFTTEYAGALSKVEFYIRGGSWPAQYNMQVSCGNHARIVTPHHLIALQGNDELALDGVERAVGRVWGRK